jgi:three-Cys-motif partner protein
VNSAVGAFTGAPHTILKLSIIEAYLSAYTLALSKTKFKTHYIDAFAGTGQCDVTIGGEKFKVPGSAVRALACSPPFDNLVFIEKSPSRARSLERLKHAHPTRRIAVLPEDANRALPRLLEKMTAADRAIVFLDPLGMTVEWSTLERIAQSRIADVWYLFSLSGLYRQATRHETKISPAKAAALTRIFGPNDWRAEFYPEKPDLFGTAPGFRELTPTEMAGCVKRWLESIFPKVSAPKILYRTTAIGTRIPIFALFFAVSNPSATAIRLAFRIANAVLKRDWETRPK